MSRTVSHYSSSNGHYQQWLSPGLIFSLFLNGVGLAYSFGVVSSQLKSLEEFRAKSETHQEKTDDSLRDILVTLKAVDTKLGYLAAPRFRPENEATKEGRKIRD